MKLEQLKVLAKSATPGPWSYDIDEREIHSDVMQDSGGDPAHIVFDVNGDKNAFYIAATNPSTVLQLIERVERLSEAIRLSIVRADDNADSYCSRPIRDIINEYGADKDLEAK